MRGLVRSTIALGLIGLAGAGVLAVWPIGTQARIGMLQGDAWRGAYLARSSGCVTCHTNIIADGSALAGGAALDTPFGSFVPPNITPDPQHGIGGWTQNQFAVAVRQGVGPDGQPYYPAFPYEFYAEFSDQDIADLWAALQTVPMVAKSALEHDVGFPFSLRWGVKLWRAAFMAPTELSPVMGKSEIWNRGQQLVNGAAHCSACHTGRNILGGLKAGEVFAGSDSLPGGATAPSILAGKLIERGWTVESLSYALRTGVMSDGDVFGGSMAEVVQEGTSYLEEEDRLAIATYLLDQPETAYTPSLSPDETPASDSITMLHTPGMEMSGN